MPFREPTLNILLSIPLSTQPQPLLSCNNQNDVLTDIQKKDENENLVNSKINVFCDFICVAFDIFHLLSFTDT